VIDDDCSHDRSREKLSMQIWFGEARLHAISHLVVTSCQALAVQFVLLCVSVVRCQPCLDVLGVVCLELALHDLLWSIHGVEHGDGLSRFLYDAMGLSGLTFDMNGLGVTRLRRAQHIEHELRLRQRVSLH